MEDFIMKAPYISALNNHVVSPITSIVDRNIIKIVPNILGISDDINILNYNPYEILDGSFIETIKIVAGEYEKKSLKINNIINGCKNIIKNSSIDNIDSIESQNIIFDTLKNIIKDKNDNNKTIDLNEDQDIEELYDKIKENVKDRIDDSIIKDKIEENFNYNKEKIIIINNEIDFINTDSVDKFNKNSFGIINHYIDIFKDDIENGTNNIDIDDDITSIISKRDELKDKLKNKLNDRNPIEVDIKPLKPIDIITLQQNIDISTQIIYSLYNNRPKYNFYNDGEFQIALYRKHKYYGLVNGVYNIKDIPQDYPIVILNKDISNLIQYSGTDNTEIKITIDGYDYSAYYGDISINVYGNFNKVSVISPSINGNEKPIIYQRNLFRYNTSLSLYPPDGKYPPNL
jgi:hypothetical protein